jgi:SAM-dependent methyltransferase
MKQFIETRAGTLKAGLKVLEIGCGLKPRYPGSVSLDANPRATADVLHDLNRFPYPFETNSFDVVIAEHVLEHLDDVVRVVEELHRILKPLGTLLVEVPHFSSQDFFTDPTHRHAFSSTSFDYFIPNSGGLFDFQYSATARFKKRAAAVCHRRQSRLRHHFLDKILHRSTLWYERNLAFVFPVDYIGFDLEVIKS